MMREIGQRLLMLIDDEPAQSRLITAFAQREGWRTLVVGAGKAAAALLAALLTAGTSGRESWAWLTVMFWAAGSALHDLSHLR